MAEILYLCLHCALNAYVGIKLEGDAVCVLLQIYELYLNLLLIVC